MTGGAGAPRPRIVLVAALARDRTIGAGGGIPWNVPGDQLRFKRLTMGTALVMGRRTFDSIGRPLPGRDNIVITRAPRDFAAAHPDTFAVASLDEALALAAARGAATVSVIGGGEIYALALPLADELLLTHVDHAGGGDAFFPKWDTAAWVECGREAGGPLDAVRYRRRAGATDSSIGSR